jgi:Sodium:dicarboxylate symporter family
LEKQRREPASLKLAGNDANPGDAERGRHAGFHRAGCDGCQAFVVLIAVLLGAVMGVAFPEGGLCRAGRPSIFQIGDVLQVPFFAVLFGFTLMKLGERGAAIRGLVDDLAHAMFVVIAIIRKAAPLSATLAGFGSPRDRPPSRLDA